MSWAFVMKHDIERMVSMVGSRPVIYFFLKCVSRSAGC